MAPDTHSKMSATEMDLRLQVTKVKVKLKQANELVRGVYKILHREYIRKAWRARSRQRWLETKGLFCDGLQMHLDTEVRALKLLCMAQFDLMNRGIK